MEKIFDTNEFEKDKPLHKLGNQFNLEQYETKTEGSSFRRQYDRDLSYDKLKNTDWKKESDYYNSYHKDKTLRMPNKEWHKLTNYKYAKKS